MSWWDGYERKSPRKVKDGIRTRSQRGAIGSTWWSKRWQAALEQIVDPGRLGRGRSYARKGQVASIAKKGGAIDARVQGSALIPYDVTIALAPLPDDAWERVFDALAERAAFAVELLAGRMPEAIEDAFAAAGASLFPTTAEDLVTDCSCPDWANPCKHVAAVHVLLGEALDDDPFLLFRLRGRTADAVLAGLRARRVAAEAAPDATVEGVEAHEPAEPLPADPSAFWSLAASLDDLARAPRAPDTPLAVLRRLGQPRWTDADLHAALGPAYQAVTRRALRTAFAAGAPDEFPKDDET